MIASARDAGQQFHESRRGHLSPHPDAGMLPIVPKSGTRILGGRGLVRVPRRWRYASPAPPPQEGGERRRGLHLPNAASHSSTQARRFFSTSPGAAKSDFSGFARPWKEVGKPPSGTSPDTSSSLGDRRLEWLGHHELQKSAREVRRIRSTWSCPPPRSPWRGLPGRSPPSSSDRVRPPMW